MSDHTAISKALRDHVLVFDGAMGTEIYARHVFTNRCFDELCLSQPELIREVHTAYRASGADVLTTNTFGANRIALGKFGLAEQTQRINGEGARIAREVADATETPTPIFVAGSIGPLPRQPEHADRISDMIVEQGTALIDGGADFLLFETQPTREAVEQCARAMTALPDVPFMLSFVVVGQCESASGETIERMIGPLPSDIAQPFAWGINCGAGPDGLLGAVRRAVQLTDLPVVVQPNAGLPKEVENRRIYFCSPEYLTTYAKQFVELGASAVGGCCGTTPDHIRAMSAAIKPLARAQSKTVVMHSADKVEAVEPVEFAQRSRLAGKLARQEWVTTVELVPPRGYDLSDTVEKSRTLHEAGVDAINIPDGPRASSRISPLITAERIRRDAQIEPILHFCCRDRNLIGMQADLLACAACEIHNILFVTGDPPKLGAYPHATGVFDTDSIGVAAIQDRLNRGIDLGGQALKPATAAVIGVGLDPTALDRQRELDRFRQKIDAGAEFAITQPVFDPDALLRFLDEIQQHSIPILAGMWPLASLRNATFMQNEVPGVEIPDSVMQRMASVESRDDQLKMGVEIAREAVDRVRERVAGIQVSAPFGRIATALAVFQ